MIMNFFLLVEFFTILPTTLAVLSGFNPEHLPYQSDPGPGQFGYNQCGTKAKPTSKCQNAFIKSATDFCMFAPPTRQTVGQAERVSVSYCSNDGYGTRLIPPETFHNLHFVRTKHYVQITARGDFTKVNVPKGDDGGELDPSGADGHGNPIGGLVFGEGFQFNHWTEFISDHEFCLRACYNGPEAKTYCEHIYDVMGCRWNIPGNYDGQGFDQCDGDDVSLPMGKYRLANGIIATWHQGDKTPAPPPNAPGKLYKCRGVPSPGRASYKKQRE
ncbi:hypothetical protein CROQUDRAFT_85697 [Cronartium quercuum f. sp. fusiforme G11]|uniref:Uncharacterized protein n=1 Tax=Cronartium quercuum f. sp. fusiforme G11 TaxID=708437 RepID=A0A9P6THX9_9BASI|nr:hypothetical protein CROQUDRAFT_85697 [Cronartium quercuum f. sp. fusiforme G11]